MVTLNSDETMITLLVQSRAMLNIETGRVPLQTPLDLVVYPQGTKIYDFLVSAGARHGKYYVDQA